MQICLMLNQRGLSSDHQAAAGPDPRLSLKELQVNARFLPFLDSFPFDTETIPVPAGSLQAPDLHLRHGPYGPSMIFGTGPFQCLSNGPLPFTQAVKRPEAATIQDRSLLGEGGIPQQVETKLVPLQKCMRSVHLGLFAGTRV